MKKLENLLRDLSRDGCDESQNPQFFFYDKKDYS